MLLLSSTIARLERGASRVLTSLLTTDILRTDAVLCLSRLRVTFVLCLATAICLFAPGSSNAQNHKSGKASQPLGHAVVDSNIFKFGGYDICSPDSAFQVTVSNPSTTDTEYIYSAWTDDPILATPLATFPIVLPPRQQQSIRISFKPSYVGGYSITLLYRYRMSSRVDTIQHEFKMTIPVTFALPVIDNPITVRASASCKDSLFEVKNPSCLDIRILGVTPQPDSNVILIRQTFPLDIPAGETRWIPFSCSKADVGSKHVKFDLECTAIKFDRSLRAMTIDFLVNQDKGVNLWKIPAALEVVGGCKPADTSFVISNPLCYDFQLLSITSRDPLHITPHPPTLPATIPAGGSLRIPYSYATLGAAPRYVFVDLRTNVLGYPTDSAIRIRLSGIGVNLPVEFSAANRLAFGDVQECQRAMKTVTLANTHCDSAAITKVSLERGNQGFSIVAPKLPRVMTPGATDSVQITFAALGAGARNDRLKITIAQYGDTYDTSIVLTATSRSAATGTISPEALEFDTIAQCSPKRLMVHVANGPCTPIHLASLRLTHGTEFRIVSNTKADIQPNEKGDVEIELAPTQTASGDITDSLSLDIESNAGASQGFIVPLHGFVLGTYRFVDAQPSLDVKGLRDCRTLDTTITLVNRGRCDIETLELASIQGDQNVTLGTVALPVTIDASGSISLPLHITYPATADALSALVLHFTPSFDTTISILTHRASDDAPLLDATLTGTTFETAICSTAVQHFTLQNNSCRSLDIETLDITPIAGDGTFTTDVRAPLRILPGATQVVTITYAPGALSNTSAQLHTVSTGASYEAGVQLDGHSSRILEQASFGIATVDGRLTSTSVAGTHGELQLYTRDGVSDRALLKSIHTKLLIEPDLLSITDVKPSSGWSVDSWQINGETLDVMISRNTTTPLVPNAEIARLMYQSNVAIQKSFDISVAEVRLNEDDPTYQSCYLSPIVWPDRVSYTIADECGDELIRNQLGNGLPVQSVIVRPNPVTSSSTKEISVDLDVRKTCEISVDLYTTLGESVYHRSLGSLDAGLHSFDLNTLLGSGTYYVRFTSANWHTTRMLSVSK